MGWLSIRIEIYLRLLVRSCLQGLRLRSFGMLPFKQPPISWTGCFPMFSPLNLQLKSYHLELLCSLFPQKRLSVFVMYTYLNLIVPNSIKKHLSVFLGYEVDQKGYKCFYPLTERSLFLGMWHSLNLFFSFLQVRHFFRGAFRWRVIFFLQKSISYPIPFYFDKIGVGREGEIELKVYTRRKQKGDSDGQEQVDDQNSCAPIPESSLNSIPETGNSFFPL